MEFFLGLAAFGTITCGVMLLFRLLPSTINPLPGQRWILPGAGVIKIVARSEGYVEYVIGVHRHDASLSAFRKSKPTLLETDIEEVERVIREVNRVNSK